MTTNPSRMRMTDDVARRPSAFANTSQQLKSGHQNEAQEDAYGLSMIPCRCCGNYKCEKTEGAASSTSKNKRRRSSLGFPTRTKKDEPHSFKLSNVKSGSESEEELNAGRTRGGVHHDGQGVVPKSFMS